MKPGKYIKGAFRLLFGFCPECNSDAPALYDCPVCDGNNIQKSLWWKRFTQKQKPVNGMKIAIHFGINQYDASYYGAGNNLSQCVNDTHVMESISERNGFNEVYTITDKQATIYAWNSMMFKMIEKLKAGDMLFITQSSHGTYMDVDGKRQTGICMNNGIIWDFEVREVLKRFKKGVKIIWLTDCCFSESNWRALKLTTKPASQVKTRFLEMKTPVKIVPTQGDKRQVAATMFIFSSSNVVQPSYEDEKGGAYTQAIAQALLNEPALSYYQLHRRASAILADKYPQTPVFETVRGSNMTGMKFLS